MARYQSEVDLLRLSARSRECFVKGFKHLDETSAKSRYTEILRAVKEVISDDKIDCLTNLSIVLEEISETTNDQCLKHYQHTDRIGNFNLIPLACKNKAIKALDYIFSERSQTLYNLSVKLTVMAENESLFSTKDEFSHNAFYYAIRSNMTDLLSILIDKSQCSGEELDDFLSKSYKELKLRNVPITKDMQLFVQSRILDFRFYQESTSGNYRTGNSWEQIKKRVELVVKYIRSIKNDYWDQDPDQMFLTIAEFIAKNIHVLKSLLLSTYDRLPWEEIEFCLIIFIKCCKDWNKTHLVYNSVLNKKQLLKHLFNFSVVLDTQYDKFKNTNVRQLAKSVNSPREIVIDKITENNSEFLELYDDYEKVRDYCSLEIIRNYADLIETCDSFEQQSHLLICRVLQVMGEHLKNSPESPKLSNKAANALLFSLRKNTRQIITKLRDSLSHEETLSIRCELEKKAYLYKDIQTDISRIKALIPDILYAMKITSMNHLMKKVSLLESFESMKETYGPFRFSMNLLEKEINKDFLNSTIKGDLERLKELLLCLEKKLKDKTIFEKSLFDRIHNKFQNKKETSENLQRTFLSNTCLYSTLFESSQMYSKHNKYVIRSMEDNFAKLKSSIPLEKIKDIENLFNELLYSICSRIDGSENWEVSSILIRTFEFIHFQMGNVKWVKEFKDKIETHKILSENLLTLKLSQLNKTLIDFDLKNDTSSADVSSFENNMELQAILEMLILDILEILKSSCSRNPFFLDSDIPLLIGRNLRNHLTHGNALIDVCLGESSSQLLVNAKKLLTAVLPLNNEKMDRIMKCNCIDLENSIYRDLRIIDNQRKLFIALGKGNMTDVEECVNEGGDVYGRDSHSATCLHFAAEAPNCTVLEWILKQGLDVNSKDNTGQTVLHSAAKFDRVDIIRYLVEWKLLSLDIIDANGKTPLHVAVKNKSNETVKYLLKLDISTTVKDETGSTALHCAIYSHNVDAAKILLEKERHVDETKSNENRTALHVAVESENLVLVKLLIEKKASVHSKCDFGETPLHLATSTKCMEIVETVVLNGADVNVTDEVGETPLHNAVQIGDTKIVEFLLKHGADVNASDDLKNVPLMIAADMGHVSIVKILLENGALVNTKNNSGLTPLHFATGQGHYQVVDLLLNGNAIADFESDFDFTALHISAEEGQMELVKLLLEEGADINALGPKNCTPLHLAAKGGHQDIVDFLIDKGADINCKDEEGTTALHCAAFNKHRGVSVTLLKKGADIRANDINNFTPLFLLIHNKHSELLAPEEMDVNILDSNGNTLLHLAAFCGNEMLVKYCISKKCNINIKNNFGATALHLAAAGNHKNIVIFLISNGVEINVSNDSGFTPLFIACICKCKDALEAFVSLDMNDLKFISEDKVKAFCYSVLIGESDFVDILSKKYKFNIQILPQDLLKRAAVFNHIQVVPTLLKIGYDINSDSQLLHILVERKQYETVEYLLKEGANPMLLDKDNKTPLHYAVAMADTDMIKILLSEKANIQHEKEVIVSALSFAICTNQLIVVKLLVDMKVIEPNVKGSNGETLLHLSALFGSLDITKYFVAEGVDINALDKDNSKPVHIAARKGFKNIVEFYLSCDDLGVETTALLLCAAENGKANVCEFLLEKCLNLNKIYWTDDRPLRFALLKDDKDVLSVLLHYGAYCSVHPTLLVKNETESLLQKVKRNFVAVKNKSSTEVEAFLHEQRNTKYCLANAKCARKESVLHYASWKGYTKIVDILLNYNANPNALTKRGCTPLHYAVKFSHTSIVKALLSNGAIYNALSQAKKTPLDYSKEGKTFQHRKIRDFLLFLTLVFTKVQNNDNSVLNDLRFKDDEMKKAVVRARNREGKTLIEMAYICGFLCTYELQMLFETDIADELESAEKAFVEKNYNGAFLLFESVLRKRHAIFGSDSCPVLDVKIRLVKILYEQDNLDKALYLCLEVYESRKKMLGENHKKPLEDEVMGAHILFKKGNKQEAFQIFKVVHTKLAEKLEADDLDIMSLEIMLSKMLFEEKKFNEVIKINNEIEQKYAKKEDDQHRIMVADSRLMRASILQEQHKLVEALKLYEEVYETKREILTPHDPESLIALSCKARVFRQQKKYDECLEVLIKVLDTGRPHLPKDHIQILMAEFFIGEVLLIQQRYVAALKIFLSLEPRIAVLGPDCIHKKKIDSIIVTLKNRFTVIECQSVFERIQNDIKETAKRDT